MLHKPETRDLRLPSHAEMFPNLYMNPVVFSRAREEAEVVGAGSRVRTLVNFAVAVLYAGVGGEGFRKSECLRKIIYFCFVKNKSSYTGITYTV